MFVDFLCSAADRIFFFCLGVRKLILCLLNTAKENPGAGNSDAVEDGSSFPIAGALGVLSTISTAVQSTVSELGMQERMGLRDWVGGVAFHPRGNLTCGMNGEKLFQHSDNLYAVFLLTGS